MTRCAYNNLLSEYKHTQLFIIRRGKRGNVKRNFSSVSQGVYIANVVTFMY